ncbi:2-hydroxyacid dehydrogenase [Sabulicella glaciei]|uniref:2-hydroxyacid dehydrogenase n=1 Tax=Sabulicella glaciei TaxID=2984948 RepID=A0ABT3NRF0_9PROT|nr:2-hydroxyacid dehydrogenase [Roseococcus sp. MDT2-1-1]MCW8084159.1 2-hydroxyacid dehydrogenase [Roseococcus sp. MDT2-1-1]
MLLQIASIGLLADRLLTEEFDAVRLWEQPDAWLTRHGAEVELVATSVRAGCGPEMLAALPRLRAISSWGVGHETLDVAGARARGIGVATTPEVLDDCVADLAWGLLMAVARRIPAADRHVRAGEWTEVGRFPLSTKVSGKRLGVLGLGRIGAAIARRGEGFAMEVRYHGRGPKPGVAHGFEPSLRELAAWCDFLVVACEGGPATRHLVSAEVLEALGPGGILVNIARGSVVDQAALIAALEAGRLGGAGLDVLENEPGAPLALRRCDNVVLTPHVGSATHETREAMERLVVDNLRAFRRDGTLLTPVRA